MHTVKYSERTFGKIEKALEYYAPRMFHTCAHAEPVLHLTTKEHLRTPPAPEEMIPIAPDCTWGGNYNNMWLYTQLTIPEEADGKILCALPDMDAREIFCFKNGKPAGIINFKNSFVGGNHSVMYVDFCAKAGQTLELAFECYAGHDFLTGVPENEYDRNNRDHYLVDEYNSVTHTYHGIRLMTVDPVIQDMIYDAKTVLQLARLPEDNAVALDAHRCLMNAFSYFVQDVRNASDQQLHDSAAKVRQLLAPALHKNGGERSRGKVFLVGSSHMDTAWLWTVEETIRKCARTYSQVLTLMDQYPDYVFLQSSVLHLDWMRRYYPDIFEGIRKRVAEGRYEPNGGAWVECDCNITGGEAMIRQFLYGIRFTRKHLNYTPDCFWLPDTFGYSAAIPQIMLGCGIPYFLTTKIDWNDQNPFPMHSFYWKGLDGSQVLTNLFKHQVVPNVEGIDTVLRACTDRYSSDYALACYGFGDGGGGPTLGMQEYIKRTQGLAGMPVIEHTTASRFMQELEQQPDLPVFDGELYLELHRGTLSSMHKIKEYNRKGEIALHDMELVNVLSGQPAVEDRDELYESLLLNQFHDILPGSSIRGVYQRAFPEMENMIARAKENTQQLAKPLTRPEEGTVSLLNTLSCEWTGAAVLDGAYSFTGHPCQTYHDLRGDEKTALSVRIGAMEILVLTAGTAAAAESPFCMEGRVLTTPYYRAEFDENGYIRALTDLEADRQVHRDGGAPLGTFWAGEDMPQYYDNWDIDNDVFRKLQPVNAVCALELITDGAVEYRLRSVYNVGQNSVITADTVFYANDRRIDFEVKADWKERHMLLKAGFDVDIRSTCVKNEVQFGHLDRPTTRNLPADIARFEICNHKWSDLSETRYGVALLNDSKYGLSAQGSDLRLTLLKTGCYPDPYSDHDIHYMSYSLLPHMDGFRAETVVQPAYRFNYRPVAVDGRLEMAPLFRLDHPGVVCESVKNAEDVENAYVLRLYEAERNHSRCTLSVSGAKSVWLTNMLEEKQEQLPIENGQVQLRFRPFEIKTLLVER